MTTHNESSLLTLSGVSKNFPGVKALDNVSFSLRKGEIMALLGENGAGKSTLIKVLTGVYTRDAGTITLNGQLVSPHSTADAQAMGIGTVYQEVNLLPNMSVADNLYIGREPRRFGMIDRKRMMRDADNLMRNYGFSLDVTRPLGHYSVAMQQIVAICRAVDLSAQVLILDEPTASLDASEVEMLFTLMAQLKAKGMSLIFVTHFLDQVYRITDRITVLRNGQFIATRDTASLPQIELIKLMLGRELLQTALQRQGSTLRSHHPVVSFEDYGKKGTIEPFNLAVRPGEVVGLAGLLGSGRTETAEVLFGIRRADRGTAKIKGKVQHIRTPQRHHGWGWVFVLRIVKLTGSLAQPRCAKISYLRCRLSAAGCARLKSVNSKPSLNDLSKVSVFVLRMPINRLSCYRAVTSRRCCCHAG